MAVTVDPKVITATKELLTSVIKKPALTDKLLNRSLFKLLHDVIIDVSTFNLISGKTDQC